MAPGSENCEPDKKRSINKFFIPTSISLIPTFPLFRDASVGDAFDFGLFILDNGVLAKAGQRTIHPILVFV